MTQSLAVTLLLFLFLGSYSQAQNFEITGVLKDKTTKQSLEAATVFMETVKDTTLITYTITDAKGAFSLEGKTNYKKVSVNISFVGYENYRQVIDLTEPIIDLGDISLDLNVATLDEVVVKSRAPITVKKDTLEFNVKSFKTKKDANIEDLLKELPGVEVDEDGKITVNGKEVNKILVNGKPFFGNDPTIATRNLTKEIVEKIQVTDTKTDDEAFAGEEGDKENKTINLTISEENNKGVFGRVAAGGGTNERFEFAGIVNVFDNDRRISILGGGNNLNSPGFSFGEIQKFFGRRNSVFFNGNDPFGIDGRNFGGGQGIVNSRNAGANYADVIGEKVDVSADYFYSGANSFDEVRTERENILPDRRFFTNSTSRSDGDADNHAVNLNFNIKVDSTFLINIKPAFRLARSENRFSSTEESLDNLGDRINESSTNNRTKNTSGNFQNRLSLTKRFGKKGSFVKFRLQNEFNREESEDFIQSETEIFGDDPSLINRDQFTDGESGVDGYNLGITYRYPLIAEKLFLDLKLGHRNDNRTRKRSTFDFDENTQQFDTFNIDLSTDFEGRNIRTTPEVSLSYNTEKFNISFGTGYVFRTLENEDFLRPEFTISQDFEAVELSSYINYSFSPKMSSYFGYNLSNRPPEVTQLNPFVDVSDPLNIRLGNPDLAPSNSHSFFGGFNNYDFQKGGGYYANFNGDIENDAIVTRTTVDENLVRSTTYENVDGNYQVGINGGYNKSSKLDSIRTIKYGAGVNINANRNINFNNNIQYASRTTSIGPNINASFTWKNLFEIRPRYNLNFSNTTFGIDAFEDQEFLRHNLSLSTALFIPKQVEWRNEINYSNNPNVAPGFQQSAWFWNSTVAYSFLKDKATITLKVYDVLNQNTNARRNANANFIQDVQSTVLEQYFLLSFSWKFNTLGSKGETRNGGVFSF